MSKKESENIHQLKVYKGFKDYASLLAFFSAIFLVATLVQLRMPIWSLRCWTTLFMGFVLISFSLVKFLDLKSFVHDFNLYDVFANHFKAYGYLYPFIEFVLGMGYLTYWFPFWTNLITFIIMLVSAIGVIKAVNYGLDVVCNFKGSILKIPFSSLSVVETFLIGSLSLMLLVFKITRA